MGKVVVVGSINVDLVFTSDIRPGAGETVLGKDFKTIPGGKGANQAVAASRLGAEVSMVGCVGNDANGEFSIKNFKANGVDTSAISIAEGVPTGVASIVVAENDNSIIVVSGANYSLTKEMIDANKSLIISADIVLLQLEIPLDVAQYTIDMCYENNVKVVLNPAPAVKLSENMIEKATYITPNEHECRIIFGLGEDDSIAEMLKKYPEKLLITVGSKGVMYHNGNDIVTVPAVKVDVVDTTGAGDTCNGALATALVSGHNLYESISFANKAAGISVTKLGAQGGMPTLEEIVNN